VLSGAVPVVRVTGSGNPSPNGDYVEDGIFGGEMSYKRTDGAYYLWYDDVLVQTVLSVIKGDRGTFHWYYEALIPVYGMEPQGTATGYSNADFI
jgi:hypothetical protein